MKVCARCSSSNPMNPARFLIKIGRGSIRPRKKSNSERRSSLNRESAIHLYDLSRDVARFWRDEEQRNVGHLFGLRKTSERNLIERFRSIFGIENACHIGLNKSESKS